MKLIKILSVAIGIILFSTANTQAQTVTLPAPPQDKGLPYTRSAHATAENALKNYTAIFAGSKYGYVNGYKVRLDNKDILRGDAVLKDGVIYIPESSACLIVSKTFQPKPIPSGLEILQPRWVYDFNRAKTDIPVSVRTFQINGANYISAADLAKSAGKQTLQTKRGLLLISDKAIAYSDNDQTLSDCIVAAFDTPEKLMEPDMTMKYIPLLKEQGKWTEHARVSPEKLKELEQSPEAVWPETPRSAYDFTGFNFKLLGSKVPAPGIYPRLLFSPEDIPMLVQHIKANKSAQKSMIEIEVLFKKTWWDPTTSDGQVFKLLEEGKIDEIRSQQNFKNEGPAAYHVAKLIKDHKPGIHNSHINYTTNCLTTMALYALLTNDEVLGKRVANALVTFYKLLEPNIENYIATSDSEFGVSPDEANNASTQWRGMVGKLPHMDLAFSLDFAGKYMTAEQKKFMQTFIAKATYGRRTNAGDGPRRAWRDINHMTWHLTHHIAMATIEGLDGFDPEAYTSGCELTRDFLEWGIDKNGQMFESNGKSGGGWQFEFLALMVQARRGDNLFGHPHLRKLLQAQTYTTAPNGKETLSSGTWGGTPLALQLVSELKAFFPEDRNADFLISNVFENYYPYHKQLGKDPAKFDLEAYRAFLEKKISGVRLPGPTYPGFGIGFPYIADWKPTTKADLNLPLNWNTDVHGIMSASSDNSDKATWMCLHVRSNHYIGSGHHHADIGMFYFSGNGINWITEPTPKTYSGRYHSEVIIDGKAEPESPAAKGVYLGANMNENGAFGSVDQTYCYTYQWCTQVQKWGTGFSKIDSAVAKNGWELEPDPEILNYFKGTSHYKMRVWWPSYNFSNFIPTLRALWNPVEYAYRSTGLIRGKHSYGLIVDDLKKDKSEHLYQWTGMLAKGVYQAQYENVPTGCAVLGFNEKFINMKKGEAFEPIVPADGDPLLLVCSLDAANGAEVAVNTLKDEDGKDYNRLTIEKKGIQLNDKVLLIPFYFGEKLPKINFANGKAVVKWADQTDELNFAVKDNRTKINVIRGGKVILESK
ncbi:MAG: hypothetical protein ACOYOT_11710 [Bacteroidales bacterium]